MVERQKFAVSDKVIKLAKQHSEGAVIEQVQEKDATSWIVKRAARYDAKIENAAAHALSTVVGADRQRADNELIKLANYVDGERSINAQDVALLTTYIPEVDTFRLIDALALGQGRVSLKMMHDLLEQDPSDPGFRLFATIVSHFRKLLLVKEHLAAGGSSNPNAIGEALGVHPYPAGKLAQQSRSFSMTDLETIYRSLQGYDESVKTGRISIVLALDLLATTLHHRQAS